MASAHGLHPHGASGGGLGYDFQPERAAYPGVIKKMAIIGHSYVRHMYVDKPLYEPYFAVKALAEPGAKVDTLRASPAWDKLKSYKPDITFLVIGGNDIVPEIDIKELANKIQGIAQEIEDLTGGYCRIIGIEKRPMPRGIDAAQFNRIRNSVNRWLKRNLAYTKTWYVSMNTTDGDFAEDGVHLKPEVSDRLFSAIIEMARDHFKVDSVTLQERRMDEIQQMFVPNPTSLDF